MEIKPARKGLRLLGVTLALPGLLVGLLLLRVTPAAGAAVLAIWLTGAALLVRFWFGVLTARVRGGTLTVEWGTAFPVRVVLPLGKNTALRWFRTPAMRALGCCIVRLEGPGGSVLLWYVSKEDALALARLLRGEDAP